MAVLASIFASYGGCESGAAYVDGLIPAVWVGAAVVLLGALVSLLVPGRSRPDELAALAAEPEPALEAA